MTVPSISKTDSQTSPLSVEQVLTLGESLRQSFASPTLRPPTQHFNGASVQVEFTPLPVAEMTADDVKTLDKARRSGAYIYLYSVAEWADAIQGGLYDIWKLRGIPDCQCIIMTSWEQYPSDLVFMVHYLAGWNCKKHMQTIKQCIRDLAHEKRIIFTAPSDAYIKVIGGKKLATILELVGDNDEQPQVTDGHK